MKCVKLNHALIAAYALRDLSGPEADLVESHLRICSSCRELAGDLERRSLALQQLRVGPSDDRLDQIRARVLQQISTQEQSPMRPSRWRRVKVWQWKMDWLYVGAAAVGLAAVTLAGIPLLNSLRHRSGPLVAEIRPPQPQPHSAVAVKPTATAETKPAAPGKKDASPPTAFSPKEGSNRPTRRQVTAQPVSVPPAPTPIQKLESVCTMRPFVLAEYAGAVTGDLIWSGSASANEIEIFGWQASAGRIQVDPVPSEIPVRLKVMSDGVVLTSAPSAANCWQSPLALKSVGRMPSRITVHWEVFQLGAPTLIAEQTPLAPTDPQVAPAVIPPAPSRETTGGLVPALTRAMGPPQGRR